MWIIGSFCANWLRACGKNCRRRKRELQVRFDEKNKCSVFNSGDFIPKSRKYECTNGAQTLVVWAFSNFVENLRTTISKKSSIAPIE